MPRQKRALSGVDPNIPTHQEPTNAKRKKVTTETSTVDNIASNKQPNGGNKTNAAAPEYIAVARPNWDISAEAYDKQVDEDDALETSDTEDPEAPNTLRNQDDLDPEWPWTMSASAIDKYLKLKKQAELRDQDIQDIYMYNDFTAYGVNEVIDNWVR